MKQSKNRPNFSSKGALYLGDTLSLLSIFCTSYLGLMAGWVFK